jgi:hypothetical protein
VTSLPASKKKEEDGVVDDGGYVALFDRDDPAESDLGDKFTARSRREGM